MFRIVFVNTAVWILRQQLLALTPEFNDKHSLTSLQLLMCCDSTYSGVGAKKVPQNVAQKTVIVHSSCGADAIKLEGHRTTKCFLRSENTFCHTAVNITC